MCGRYALFGPVKRSRQQREAAAVDWLDALWDRVDLATPRYNVAPSQMMPVVRRVLGTTHMEPLRWGLVPSWTRDLSIGGRAFNARAETVAEKPMFRAAFRARRCLVPVSGYYEWTAETHGKQPYFVCDAASQLLMLAGLWEQHDGVGTAPLETFTVLTEAAAPALARLHPRMPVMLAPEFWRDWLQASPGVASALLAGHGDVPVQTYPVSREVGSPRLDRAELLRPLPWPARGE